MAEPLLPRDDVSVIGMDDTSGGIFGFPSYEGYRMDQIRANERMALEQQYGRRPEQPLNIGFGAGGIDAAGPVRLSPFVVSTSPYSGMFDYTFGNTLGTGGFQAPTGTLGGGAGAGGGGGEVTTLPPFVVTETTTAPSSNLNLLGYDSTAPFTGPVAGNLPTGDGGATVLPPVTVSANRDDLPAGWSSDNYTSTPDWFRNYINRTGAFSPVVLPPFVVTDTRDANNQDVVIPNFPVNRVPSTGNLNLDISADPNAGRVFMGPVARTGPAGGTTAGGGGGGTTATGTTATPERNFARELGTTLAGLQQYQPQLLGMYKDLYQSFMPQGLTAAETSGLAQMRADEAKLNRLRQGILSPEDIRTATQGAREAYGARGQVFAPGAIGAEILNREAIRQQREDQARAAYQQSMGNVLNVANLQTGNIFQPIGSLLSGTFNPLGAYPADVYGTNVNAALARDIAERNKEAAIESARMAGAAGTSAARTSAAGQLGAAALPFVLTSIFCWVAREVYGEHNPRWQMFRHWMLTRAPRWFVRLYLRYGERFAKWLKRNPWLKPMIRRWMDSRIESMRPNHALKEAF